MTADRGNAVAANNELGVVEEGMIVLRVVLVRWTRVSSILRDVCFAIGCVQQVQ